MPPEDLLAGIVGWKLGKRLRLMSRKRGNPAIVADYVWRIERIDRLGE
jgi:hypothetical protein